MMSIILSKNAESELGIKYTDVQYYYIKELINKKKLSIRQICSSKILADGMTKTLLLIEVFQKY